MVMPALLLQKPSSKSKSKDHSEALKRRLVLWKKGDLNELMRETETIQLRLKSSTPSNNIEAVSKKFAALMKKGKLNAAVKLLTSSMEGGILPLDEETMTLLQSKHPESSDLSEDAVVDVEPVEIHPVVFNEITADSIKIAAMKTRGGAGPSGMDADGWRHILVSRNFGDSSDELRTELAMSIRKLCTEKLALKTVGIHMTSSIEAFLANRLVPLDKCPGLRPIGIGEVLRRIAGKVFMSVVKGDIQDSVGSLQVCAGQPGGCEAAIHAMRTIYEEEDTDAVLLIDAANAFNSINRKTMLKNIERICPIAYIYAYNCYSPHARLFVVGGKEIRSMEGTTQGDPPSMAFYAIGLLPLIWCLSTVFSLPAAVDPEDPAVQVSIVPEPAISDLATVESSIRLSPPVSDHNSPVATMTEQNESSAPINSSTSKQVAYADDLTGAGKLHMLRKWLDGIIKNGPKFGYNAEPSKSWLIVNEDRLAEAEQIFEGAGVKITTAGKKHLGAAIGTIDYREEFMTSLVRKWVDQIETLSKIAAFEPHTAYAAFTSCIRHRYTYYMRTIPNISQLLEPLEQVIRTKFLPALLEGRSVTDDERKLLSLPPRLGGMGIIIPTRISDREFELSKSATKLLSDAIILQQKELPTDFEIKSREAKHHIRKLRRDDQASVLENIRDGMTVEQKRGNEICREKGASNWLTALPIDEKDYHLSKREFWDAVNVRYGWPLSRLPSKCACGVNFDLEHSLSCKKGGFVIQRHNELRDLTADLLSEVCKDVSVEPQLQGLTGEILTSGRSAIRSNEARLDISARGVWCRNQRAFFDVRVFNPNAPRYVRQPLPKTYVAHEKEKKRKYNERVLEVENGTFTPLVFSVFGGMGQECQMFYKRLCQLLSEKRRENLSLVASWVRTKTSFALLRSTLMSIRGSRYRYYKETTTGSIDMELDVEEASVREM